MRKNNFLKVGLVGLFSLMLTIGVSKGIEVKEVKAADEVALVGETESIVIASGYNTYSDNNWVLTFGGNSQSGGTNSNNRSRCKLTGDNAKYADGTNVTTSNTAFALATKSSYENISRVTVEYTGGSNYSRATLYLNYSVDGSSYTPVTLTSGTQGMSVGSINTLYEMDFEPLVDASYLAIIFKDTGSSGNFRLDYITVTLYSEIYEQEGTVTSIDLDSSTMPTEVYTGSQWDTSGIVVNAHYDDNSTSDVTAFSEISLDPEVVPSTVGEISVRVTATYETFKVDKEFTVNVIERTYYEKILSIGQLKIGSKYLIATDINETEVYVMSSSFVSGRDDRRQQITPEIIDNKITYEDNMELVTLEANGNNYSLKTKSGQYLSYSGTDNSLSNSDSAYAWSLITTSNGIEIACATSTDRTIQKNKSLNYFATYTSDQKAAYLYGVPNTEISFDLAQENSIIKIGDSIDLNVVIANVDNPVVNWSIAQDGEIVSLNQNTGTEVTVNGLATGQATITATMVYDGETYTDSIIITVEEAPVYDVDFTSDVETNPFNASGVNWAYYMDAGVKSSFLDVERYN